MSDKWSKYEVTPESKADKWSKYEVTPTNPNPQDIGEIESGVRGAINTTTQGLGNKLQAYLRAVPLHFDPDTLIAKDKDNLSYLERARQLEDEERIRNAQAAQANPKSYMAGSILGALPTAANIANVARAAAPVAGSQILGSAAGGAGAGGVYGALQGVGASDSDFANLPSSVLKHTAIGAGTGALTGGLAGKAIDKSQGALVSKLKDSAPTAVNAATNELTLPGIGALGGMAYRNIVSDNPTDWSNDPYSAAIETGIAGAQGAAAGAAAKYGTNKAGELIKKVPGVMGAAATKLGMPGKMNDLILGTPGTILERATNKSLTGGDQGSIDRASEKKHKFDKLSQWLNQQTQSEEEKRKLAMQLSSTPEGRSMSNEET